MRALVVGFAALWLAACAAAPDPFVHVSETVPSGNWRIERQQDPITLAPLPSAILVTSNSSNSSEPQPRPAMLQLTCFKGAPMVRFAFEFRVGSDPNSVLGYRFDENPGGDVKARFLHTYNTVVIEDRSEVARFAGELAAASVLHVRIRSLNAGRTTAEFGVAGAPAAIEAAFADCRPSAEPQNRKRTS